MYIPPAFVKSDLPKLHDFIESYSFGTLVSQSAELCASHIPFLLDRKAGPQGRLIGHMARANSQWQPAGGRSVLVIFTGPHAYISPTWYESENVVPTWNYVAVHVYGTLRVVEDRAALMQIVRDTVDYYEQALPQPWTFDGSAAFYERLVQMIVGFHVDIDRIEGKWKLSQNHPRERRERVVRALLNSTAPEAQEVARLMRQTLSEPEVRESSQ
jgi:transcriptional regulator